MNTGRLLAFVAFLVAALWALGWAPWHSLQHAIAAVAVGLALEVLAGVPVVLPPR